MAGVNFRIGRERIRTRGLNVPGVATANVGTDTIKFGWKSAWDSDVGPPNPYPLTVLYKGYPRDYGASNNKYFTAFFWGNNGTFTWSGGAGKCYYGAHPFPTGGAPGGTGQLWSVPADGSDYTNSSTTTVTPNQWHDCVFRCRQNGSNWEHQFFYDYGRDGETTVINGTVTDSGYGSTQPPTPSFFWLDCPWPYNAGPPKTGEGHELWYGYLRGFQIYTGYLDSTQIAAVAACDTDAAVLAACTANSITTLWYLNMNPTPDDVSDKSGNGNHPAWYNANRPTLWTP